MRPETISVRHYCPGGREHGGGIGRMIGYLVDEAGRRGADHAVRDTRGTRWSPLPSLAMLAAAVAAMALDRLTSPRRIHHIHLAGRGSTARKLILTAAARALGCLHLLHLHDYDYEADFVRRAPWLQRLIRRMFGGAERVLVLGRRDRDTAIRLLGAKADRVEVFHNGVPDPGEPQAAGGGKPAILFLGRLGERKGVPELLTALASPAMAGLGWRAVLAGDGPVESYREQAAALGLAGRVTMPGWLSEDETRALCRRCDILVLPSHGEGMAMAVLEGLANGLAVVTTPVGAHREVITDGVTGLFVPVGDAAALAGTLARLVADAGLCARLSAEARSLFLSRFHIAAYAGRIEALYGAVAARAEAVAATG